MSEKQASSMSEPRRKGHRQSELLFSLKKTTLYAGLTLLFAGLSTTYYLGSESGYERAQEAAELRTLDRLEKAAAGDVNSVAKAAKNEALLVVRAEEERVPTKVSDSSTISKGPIALKASPRVAKPRPGGIDLRKRAPLTGRFGIQLGAFKTKDEAHSFVRKHESKLARIPVFLISVSLKKRGVWTRVRVGEFRTRRSATKVKKGFGGALTKGSIVVSYR